MSARAQDRPIELTMQNPTTEQRNPSSAKVDTLSAFEIVELINQEDAKIASAVEKEKGTIAEAVDIIASKIRAGGRLFYCGAGTSGRLGVLDASECPPTFSTPPSMVVGIIAGGQSALTRAIEGAEDDRQQGANDLMEHEFNANDVLVGIATSGRTPYVLGALEYANSLGAKTIGFSCNEGSAIHSTASLTICPVVGPEIVSGSTRLKSGTATKMVLNMLTTGAMILLGKTYGNLMVDLRASNEKLKLRSIRIVSELTGLTHEHAETILDSCDGEVKTAIVSHLCGHNPADARSCLNDANGQLRVALESSK